MDTQEFIVRGSIPIESILIIDDTFLELLPAAAYVCSADGTIVRHNRKAAELWGRSPDTGDRNARFCGSFRLYRPDGQPLPHRETPMAEVLRSGVPAKDVEIMIEQPEGKRLWVLINAEPIRNEQGEVTGAIGCFQDITARKALELQLRSENHDLEQKLLKETERRARNLLEALPVAIYTTDTSGHITYYNQAAVDFAGRRPELGDQWCVTLRLHQPDGTPLPHDQCPMAMALKEKRAIHGAEAVAELPNGARVPFMAYPTPLFDDAGNLTGAVNMLIDITERKRGELAMQQLAAIVESSFDAIVSKDLNGVITSWNKGAEQLFGYTAEEIIGKQVIVLIPLERHHEETVILGRIRRGERVDHYETVRRRKDGTLINVSLTVSPVRDSNGRIIGASKIARDITDRKRAETHQQLLIHELNHRVKNTLAIVQSVAAQSFRGETGSQAYGHFEARLVALARAHDILTRESWESANLRDVVTEATSAHCPDADRYEISGTRLRVSATMALSMAMALHELCTNAAKYGALSNATGRVHIEWHVIEDEEGRRLCLHWEEKGGPPVAPPRKKGFGSRLIERGLARELNAEVRMDYAPAGVVCQIEAPLR